MLIPNTGPVESIYYGLLFPVLHALFNDHCIAKKDYYTRRFELYKYDIRKTWENIKTILNKSHSQTYFLINGNRINDKQTVADKFTEYFTSIGPDLANKIPHDDKNDFRKFLLKMHCSSAFQFKLINSGDVEKNN